MARYKKHERSLKFTENDNRFGGFRIEALGVSEEKRTHDPYIVVFRGKEIFRSNYHSKCKYKIEEIVWDFRDKSEEFCKQWNLQVLPEKDDIWPQN